MGDGQFVPGRLQAYGQTGSGKTYTMEGPSGMGGAEDPASGMIPKSVWRGSEHVPEVFRNEGFLLLMWCVCAV